MTYPKSAECFADSGLRTLARAVCGFARLDVWRPKGILTKYEHQRLQNEVVKNFKEEVDKKKKSIKSIAEGCLRSMDPGDTDRKEDFTRHLSTLDQLEWPTKNPIKVDDLAFAQQLTFFHGSGFCFSREFERSRSFLMTAAYVVKRSGKMPWWHLRVYFNVRQSKKFWKPLLDDDSGNTIRR